MRASQMVSLLILISLTGAMVTPAFAKRKETMNEPLQLGEELTVFLGSVAAAGVFWLSYRLLSKTGSTRTEPSPAAHPSDLQPGGTADYQQRFLMSGSVGSRQLFGENSDFVEPGIPIGVSLRYRLRGSPFNPTNIGILFRQAEHDGKGDMEGARYHLSKIALTLGVAQNSRRASFDYDFGIGIMRSTSQFQGESDDSGFLLLNFGTGFSVRLTKHVSVGPRLEFSKLKYLKPLYSGYPPVVMGSVSRTMYGVEFLAACTVGF